MYLHNLEMSIATIAYAYKSNVHPALLRSGSTIAAPFRDLRDLPLRFLLLAWRVREQQQIQQT